MAEQDGLSRFLSEIESEITDVCNSDFSSGAVEFRENAYTRILSEELEDRGILESSEICYLNRGSGASQIKVNGYGLPDEEHRLDLITTLYFFPDGMMPAVGSLEVRTSFNRLERFLDRAFSDLGDQVDPSSDEFQMVTLINERILKFDMVCFHLFTNGRLSMRKERERKKDVCGLQATYEVWDLERFRRLRESGRKAEPLNVNLKEKTGGLPCVLLEKTAEGMQSCITVFPGSILNDLYSEFGTRLLELNVRSYLQARGKVNKGILTTLRESPRDFLAFNNGITVVAENVVIGDLPDGSPGLMEIKGMQIVNGGQTTASIHRAARDFRTDLSDVFVQAKITIVDQARFQEIVPLISKYSNTQNKVTEADLSSNHQFHIGMERVSRREWTPDQKSMWFYERARGSYQTAKAAEGTTPASRRRFEEKYPPSQRFTKEDLARFEMAWLGFPYYVSRGGQKCYIHFIQTIIRQISVTEDWEPEPGMYYRFIAKGILFREAQRIIRADSSITAYRIDVAAYLISLLGEKTARRLDLDRIWRDQKLSETVTSLIAAWAPMVFQKLPEYAQKEGRHIGESFKSEACWRYMLEHLNLQVPDSLQEELISVAGGQPWGTAALRRRTLSPIDQNNIARCTELGTEEWSAIAEWGQESGKIDFWQRGLARTLAGYAAEGWSKKPTQKQARDGVKIINIARDEGVLGNLVDR